MRSSAVLALFGATLAIAAPAHQALHKKALVTNIVTDIVYVTVTAGDLPATTSIPEPTTVVIKHTVYAAPTTEPETTSTSSSTSTTPPPPPPTTTSTPEPVPEPTTSIVVPEVTIQAAAVVPVTSEAPVVKVAATTAAAPAAASLTGYQSAALNHHKLHRANHTAPELTWDGKLATYAETIAKTCVFAHDM